jgi:hypothetical protein
MNRALLARDVFPCRADALFRGLLASLEGNEIAVGAFFGSRLICVGIGASKFG